MEEKLRPFIANQQVRRIVTHNNWGEYGHCQHRLVNKVVRKLAVEMKKDVWALAVKIKDINVPAINSLGNMGLPSVQGYFNHHYFHGLREEYRTRFFPPEVNNKNDLWTFFEGVYEYPYGQQTFIKLVDAGKDLTQVYASFRQLEQEIPVHGDCGGI